jgi:hypothetical protein
MKSARIVAGCVCSRSFVELPSTIAAEQLFIAFVLQRATALGIECEQLRLVQFEQFRGRQVRILIIGELNEEAMAARSELSRESH